MKSNAMPKTTYNVECRGADGRLKWTEDARNLVTDQGVSNFLNTYFRATGYSASWYLGLITGPTPTLAAGDTAATHAGWTEFVGFGEAGRQPFSPPAGTGASLDNSTAKANFSVTAANATVSGVFLSTSATKGGTAGILYAEAKFLQGDKLVSAGDSLAVTCTVSGVTQ
jgi:hypothetical protein